MSFLIGIIAGSAGGIGVGTVLEPALQRPRQELFAYYKPTLPNPQELVNLRFRGYIDEKQYTDLMLRHGYDKGVSSSIFNASRALLAMGDAVNLKRRKLIDDAQYKRLALANGYEGESTELAEKALAFYPAVGDLIRFAVREGYSPDIVSKFKLDEDLPAKFIEEATKAGMSKEDATLFWRAHWELPSIQMGYEMFHRGIIKKDELELLLRTLDVMPFWRDKLIQISQTPYTRVDTRRMYQLGVLDQAGVFKSYKDIGYDDEHAGKLTEFTIKDVMAEERDLTKAEILKLYSFQEIKREDAFGMLKGLGYDDTETDFLLSTQDLKQKTADTTELIKSLTEQFVNTLISEDDFKEALSHLSLKGDAMDRTFKNALLKKLKARRQLEKTDVQTLFKKKLIDEEQALVRLKALNYSDEDSQLLLASATPAEEGK